MENDPAHFIQQIKDIIDELTGENGTLKTLQEQQLELAHNFPSNMNNDEPILTDDRIQSFKTKLNNHMFPIPFIGEGNAGKTTLINALLGGIFFPYGMKKTTLVRTYIRHDPNVHYGPCLNPSPCTSCPQLFDSFKKDNCLAFGQKNILRMMEAQTEKAIENEEHMIFVLHANVPCFSGLRNSSPLIPYLVDCCGIEWIKQDTQGFLSVMSAVVAVFSYRDQDPLKLKTAEVLTTLESLKKLEKLFAVSQFDIFYDPDSSSGKDGNLDENQVKEHLAHVLPAIAKKENVFPVSGKWAVNARIFQSCPIDKKAEKTVTRAREDIAAATEREDDQVDIKEVEKRSNVTVLEDRINSLVSTFDHTIWSEQIYEECLTLIKTPINVGEMILRQVSEEYNKAFEEIQMYDGLLTKYDDCTKELAQWNDEESLKNKFVNALQERFEYWWFEILESVITKKIQQYLEEIIAKIATGSWFSKYKFDDFITHNVKELEDIIVPECLKKQFLLKIGSHVYEVQVSQMEEIEKLSDMRYKVIGDLIKFRNTSKSEDDRTDTNIEESEVTLPEGSTDKPFRLCEEEIRPRRQKKLSHGKMLGHKKEVKFYNEASIRSKSEDDRTDANIEESEVTTPKVFAKKEGSTEYWDKLLRLCEEEIRPRRQKLLSHGKILGHKKEVKFYNEASISGEAVEFVMETIIEEVRTSKDIKYSVLVWFMDMAMETIFLHYKLKINEHCQMLTSDDDPKLAEKVEEFRKLLLEMQHCAQKLRDIKSVTDQAIEELKRLLTRLEETRCSTIDPLLLSMHTVP